MDYACVRAYAKVNLTLDIAGVSGGYHLLDSLVASVDIYDEICVRRREDGLVRVTMHGLGENIPPEGNNALACAERYVKRFGTTGADITVNKRIPIGAGLGGSSADVAGVLNALNAVYGATDYSGLKEIADSLGSDCGYMLNGGFARIAGRGDRVERIDCPVTLYLGLLLPSKGVSTAECFKLYDGLNERQLPSTENAVRALVSGDCASLGKGLNNALTRSAILLNNEIEDCITALEGLDPLGVGMTGSGSGVFALFATEELLRQAQARYRGSATFITTKTVIPSMEER